MQPECYALIMAQDEEMRALQRENGLAGQRTADLRERLNFQCFKYELLVDMVCPVPSSSILPMPLMLMKPEALALF